MAEGTGAKDVSAEIEDEEQVLGERKSEDLDKEKPENDEDACDEEDDGIDMENEFDGTVQDVKKEEGDESESSGASEDELDEEMGDLGPESSAVDEKLWNGDDGDDDDAQNDDSKDEKVEDGSEVKDAVDTQLAASTSDDKKKDKRGEEAAADAPEDEKQPENQENQLPDPEDLDFDAHEVNEEPEHEDNQHLPPRAPEDDQELVLPPDLNLDGDADPMENDDVDDSKDDGDNEAALPDAEDLAFPEVSGEDEPPKPDTNNGEPDTTEDGDDAAANESEVHPQAAKDESEEPVDEPEPMNIDPLTPPNPSLAPNPEQHIGAQQQAAGNQNESQAETKNQDAVDNSMPVDASSVPPLNSEFTPQQNPSSTNASESSPPPSSTTAPMQQQSHADGGAEPQPQTESQPLPDPSRSLADSLESWKRRLNILNGIPNAPDNDESSAENIEIDDIDLAAFTQPHQQHHDAETLAAATLDQAESMAHRPPPPNTTPENDTMDVQEEASRGLPADVPPPPPPNQPSPIDSLSKAKSKSKRPPPTQDTPDPQIIEEEPNDLNALTIPCPPLSEQEQSFPFTRSFDSPTDETIPDSPPQDPNRDMGNDVTMKLDDEVPLLFDNDSARQLWLRSCDATQILSQELCEQLRLILEPTLTTKLKGDYKTGKRLNMKKMIPFIASEFRKDKIWLRRTKPNKRDYNVMLAVDDSKSMCQPQTIQLLVESLALITRSLQFLEVGDISVVKFGTEAHCLHPFSLSLTDVHAHQLLRNFSFHQQATNILSLFTEALKTFSTLNSTSWRLMIVLSDGVLSNHQQIQARVRDFMSQRILVVVVVLDSLSASSTASIMDTKRVSFEDGKMVISKYMDTFPFDHFVLLRDVQSLPRVLSMVLRQWFELVREL